MGRVGRGRVLDARARQAGRFAVQWGAATHQALRAVTQRAAGALVVWVAARFQGGSVPLVGTPARVGACREGDYVSIVMEHVMGGSAARHLRDCGGGGLPCGRRAGRQWNTALCCC